MGLGTAGAAEARGGPHWAAGTCNRFREARVPATKEGKDEHCSEVTSQTLCRLVFRKGGNTRECFLSAYCMPSNLHVPLNACLLGETTPLYR